MFVCQLMSLRAGAMSDVRGTSLIVDVWEWNRNTLWAVGQHKPSHPWSWSSTITCPMRPFHNLYVVFTSIFITVHWWQESFIVLAGADRQPWCLTSRTEPRHVSGSIAGLRGPLLLRASRHGRGSAALGAALLPSGSSLYGWVRKLLKIN